MAVDYFTRVNGSLATLDAYAFLQQAIAADRAAGLIGRAAAIEAIYLKLRADLERLAIRSSGEADKFVRAALDASRVRPKRPPGRSGDIGGHVVSRPLSITALPIGSFGIADKAELDKAVNPDAPGSPYWMAVEFGSSAALGRIVPGYFQPGNARPNPTDGSSIPRGHAYFEQMPYSRGMPAMQVQKPIHPHRFLETGSNQAVAWHMREREAIQRQAISALKAL